MQVSVTAAHRLQESNRFHFEMHNAVVATKFARIAPHKKPEISKNFMNFKL
jgi:hypothetical protein